MCMCVHVWACVCMRVYACVCVCVCRCKSTRPAPCLVDIQSDAIRQTWQTCFANHSFWPHLRCDPWCESLEPPPHASVFPAERRRVGWNVTVQCDDRYYLTRDDKLVTNGAPALGDLTFGHLRTRGLEWYLPCSVGLSYLVSISPRALKWMYA